MPAVISYEDAELLGSLSFAAGREPAYAEGVNQGRDRAMQQAQLLQQGRQQQQQRAQQQQQFDAQQAMQQQDRQQQMQQQRQEGRRERQHETQQQQMQAQQDQQEFQRGIRREAFEQELRAKRQQTLEQQRQQGRVQTDERRHQQRMEQVEREAELGRFGGSGQDAGATYQGGAPGDDMVEQELREHGGMLPFEAGDAMLPQSVGRRRERTMETAENLSGLPSGELESILRSSQPSDQMRLYFPYIRAVLNSRQNRQQQRGASGANTGGAANLRDMSDEELDEYARSLNR